MLGICDMSKKDKIFYFVEGLKPWAKSKLYEQLVQELFIAYIAAEQLLNPSTESAYIAAEQLLNPSTEQSHDVKPKHWTVSWCKAKSILFERGSKNYQSNSPKSGGGERTGTRSGDHRPSQQR